MPLIVFILMSFSVLTIMVNLNSSKALEVTKEIDQFVEKNKIEDKSNILDSIGVIYNNNYGDIHGNTFTSNLIKSLSNQEGDEDKVFLFNKNKFCTYTIPERESGEVQIKSRVEELRDIEYNKNLKCGDISLLLEKITDNGYTLNSKELEIIEDFKNLVSSKYFLRFDAESIMEFKNLKVPSLNLYIYDVTKRFLPNIQSEFKIETVSIVNKKINESKFLLDQIANGIVEKGKRSFKGYLKSDNYANTNSFTNLAEGVYLIKNGVTTYEMISLSAESGFQTGNLMAIPTRYMTSSTEFDFKTKVARQWETSKKRVDCGFANSFFQNDASVRWHSDNAFYSCKIIDLTSTENRFDKLKPEGFCSLNDMCAINFKLNNRGKIIDSQTKAFTLKDYLQDKTHGFSFDLSKFFNPFFPEENFYLDDNFILSSTNGNKPNSSNVGISLGIKVVARPFGNRAITDITLADKVNYELNYLVNKYYITY